MTNKMNSIKIMKRDGRLKSFNTSRIQYAIDSASLDVGKYNENDTLGVDIAEYIEDYLVDNNIKCIGVEEIQDLVIERLKVEDIEVANAYQKYREERERIREASSKTFKDIENIFNQTSEEVINNANKAGDKLQTYRAMVSDVACGNYADAKIIPPYVLKEHGKSIYLHDKSYLPIPIFNCILVNWMDMLENGFHMGSTFISSPQSITTAVALLSQIISHTTSNTYGGNTLGDLDLGLEKYIERSYKKHLKVAKKWIKKDKQKAYAWDRLKKEVYDSVQGFEYEITTLMNSRGEQPFETITFGRSTTKFGRLFQKAYLETRYKGFTDGTTPVFPKICFFLEKGLNLEPNDPNYDIFKLAVRCSSVRMYPDYLNIEKLIENTGDTKSPMGCVDGQEVITYKYKNKLYVESFKRMWNRFSNIFEIKEQNIKGNYYIDLNDVSIYDTKDGFVDCKRIIKNFSKEWLKIKMTNGRLLTCTTDHPFATKRGRIFAKDLNKNDIVTINSNQYNEETINFDEGLAWALGLFICDGCYDDQFSCSLGRDEQELVDKFISEINRIYNFPCDKINWWEYDNKRNYTEIRVRKYNKINKEFCNLFGGLIKNDRQIPNEVFSWNYKAKLNFLAGMIDADGYINNKTKVNIVQLGSTNKELSLQQLALMQSLGMKAKVYENHYNSKDKSKIRYRIESVPTYDLINALQCNKKKENFINNIRTNKNICDNNIAYIKEIIKLDKEDFSYDVTTSSDHFEVSGIYSHNCRSFLGTFRNNNGELVTHGRFNQGVVSINLPRLAIQAKGNENKFYELLDNSLELTRQALMIRHNMLKTVKAKQCPILYMEGAVARLNAEDSIEPLLLNGYSSISIGYVGLHNAMVALYGKSYFEDKEMLEKGKAILQYLRDYCEKQKKLTTIGFSLYSTPAETLATKFCRQDTKDFGVIDGVNDLGYYENSFHYPSVKDIIAFDKIDIESSFPKIASGGAINYVQFGNMEQNLDALEQVIRYAYDKVHYFGVNTRPDRCLVCGYKGLIDTENITTNDYICPQCGNKDKSKMNIVIRICGYLGSLSERPTIDGKMKEMNTRVVHLGEQ